MFFLGLNIRQWWTVADHYLTKGYQPAVFTGQDAVRELLYMKYAWELDGGTKHPRESSFLNGTATNPKAMELATILLINAMEATMVKGIMG